MKKIVLVEDERYLADIYLKKLTDENTKIFSSAFTDEAEKLIEKEKPDLIILDILLPKEDGLTFLGRLREKGNQTPVVILSNFEDRKFRLKAQELNVKNYFLKTDYTPSQIVGLIKQYL